ncbi:hypothetical protein ACFOEE_09130 [Pseudoalteromonas fenneropenaei]|uniref:Uncharacterized protein n=1 Tax=Pseudoalteromonas fenneropenaei TaxID=1737459 RepID=A0ABV7CJ76_9GAMM
MEASLNFKTEMYMRPTEGVSLSSTDIELPKKVRCLMMNAASDETDIVICNDRVWVISNSLAKHASLADYEEFQLCYQSPAKGAGNVAIKAKPKSTHLSYFSILNFGVYSENNITAAVCACHLLENLLGYQIKIAYHGSDC